MPRGLVAGEASAPTLGSIADRLGAALANAGYSQLSYHAVPRGYAVVSRLERILEDGRPSPDRWTFAGRLSLSDSTLSSYLSALFLASPGYYRVIVFVLSPVPFSQTDEQVSADDAEDWLRAGWNVLPGELRARSYGEDFACTALIYEFKQLAPGERARLETPSAHTGETHLLRAGVLPLPGG